MCGCFFFFKQKTAYEMRISDWSSDVCSSDLSCDWPGNVRQLRNVVERTVILAPGDRIGRIDIDLLLAEVLGEQGALGCNGSAALMRAPLREAREPFERNYLHVQIRRYSGARTCAVL